MVRITAREIAGILLLGVFYLMSRSLFLFSALTAASGIFAYYHSRFNRTPFDFKLALLFGLFIARHYGLGYTVLFLFISDIVPSLLGGASIGGPSVFFWAWYFIINAVSLLFPNTSLVLLGPLLVLLEAVGSYFITVIIGGTPGPMAIAISTVTVLIRIVYFTTLGNLLEFVFRLAT